LRVVIRILVDNLINSLTSLELGLRTSYGFSALVDVGGTRILFDTGLDGEVLLHNIKALGIDPDSVDYVVLSHRHSDHTGGLLEFLRARTRPVMVVAHPAIFEPAFARVTGKLVDVGLPYTRQQLEEAGARLVLVDKPLELAEGVVYSGEIPRKWGPSHTGLVYRVEGGRLVEDPVVDDAAIYVKTPKGFLALTGCGHAGIENIVEYGAELLKAEFRGIVGGLHLLGVKPERVREVADYISSKNPEVVAPTHCTGPLAHWLLLERLGKAYKLASVGDVVEY